MEPILNLKEFLTFLSLGGAAVATQVLVSILVEKAAWFQALSEAGRLALTVGLAAVLGVVATLIVNLTPPETLQALQPYFLSVVLAVSPFIGGELAHRFLKKPPVTQTTVTSVAPESTTTTVSTDAPPAPDKVTMPGFPPAGKPASPWLGDGDVKNRTNEPRG